MKNNLQGELEIMKNLGIKPNYAALAREYDMDWRTVKKYNQGYKGKPKNRNKISRLEKYRQQIVDKLKIKRISLTGVYEFMVKEYGIEEIGTYSNFLKFAKKNKLISKQKNDAHPRYETAIGEQAQVDWKEDISLVSKSGEIFTINVFHITLGFSKYSHLEISLQKRTDDVYRCLINCFKAFGGIPKVLLFDNMSTVANINGNKKSLTTGIKKFAKDFEFKVRLCGTRRPETKGTVEARNKIVDWIRAYNNEFETIDDLIQIINDINKQMNIKINQETGMSPVALFYKEKEYLHPLPKASIIDLYLSPNKYKVSNEALIRYENSKYSVPPKFIGEEVTVDVLTNKLYIYYKGKLITSHALTENPVNYHKEHYVDIMKGKVKETDMEATVNNNLKIMDKILEARKIEVSNTEATKSEAALIAYLNSSQYGTWIINQYEHMSKEKRKTFVTGMNMVLPFVENKETFMSKLKFSLKSNECKTLDYDCWINDFMSVNKSDCILTSKGYEILKKKYAKKISDFIEEQIKINGGNENGNK